MPALSLQFTSIVFLVLSVAIALGTVLLARAHLSRITRLSSGQTRTIIKKLARLPASDRLDELHVQASPESVEWRIAEEAKEVEPVQRAFVVDSLLADIQLELDARAAWPKAAVRLAGASGVFLMALAISLHLEVFVAVILLLVGIFSALWCMSLERQAHQMANEVRQNIDALIDVLELRDESNGRGSKANAGRNARRSRRRSSVDN